MKLRRTFWNDGLPACNARRLQYRKKREDVWSNSWPKPGNSYGRIDVRLVCNAAVNPYYGLISQDSRRDLHQDHRSPTCAATCGCATRTIPRDASSGATGSVIIVSSIAGHLRGQLLPGMYATAKAADMQLVRNLAVEWGPMNVRINGIAPGLVRNRLCPDAVENPEILPRRSEHAASGASANR